MSWGVLPLFVGLILSGCTPSPPEFHDPQPRPLGRDLPTASAAAEGPDGAMDSFEEPKGPITLRDALVAALTHNPRLRIYSWEMRAKEAETIQAGVLPNPELTAEVENFGGGGEFGGFQASETTLSLSQLVLLGGKRDKRIRVARFERELAAWDYEMARIEVFTATTKAFVELLAAQEQLTVAEEMVEVAEGIVGSVARRVEAGAASPVEENRARVELETTRIDRQQLYRRWQAARRRLAMNWGSSRPVFTKAIGNLESIPPPPKLDDLLARVAQNPRLARWATEMEWRKASADLQRSRGVLDLTVGAGGRYFAQTDDLAFIVQVGMPLQLFDRNQGAIQAATLRIDRARAERRDQTIRTETMLSIDHERLLAAQAEVSALRQHALPQAETAFAKAQKAYLRGSMRFIDVLDTERLLFELKSRYFSALARYHSAVAEIERLTAAPIDFTNETTGRP